MIVPTPFPTPTGPLEEGTGLAMTPRENIARGFEGPALLMEAWIASPTHNAILLGPLFTKAGIGFLEGPSPSNAAATGPWVTLNCTN